MRRCTVCFYGKRTTLATYEWSWTCLHPKAIDMHPLGRPILCTEMRGEKGACGPEGSLFSPTNTPPEPLHRFRQ